MEPSSRGKVHTPRKPLGQSIWACVLVAPVEVGQQTGSSVCFLAILTIAVNKCKEHIKCVQLLKP